jgi:hypothetical protein
MNILLAALLHRQITVCNQDNIDDRLCGLLRECSNCIGIKEINLDSLYIGLRTANPQIISNALNASQITSDQQEISRLARP